MVLIGYHGTYTEIDSWNLENLGKNQGQTIFPGIYFSEYYDKAKEYADLAVSKFGGKARVYIAECEIEKPLDLRNNKKIFNTFRDITEFCKKYFPNWFDSEGNLLGYKIDYLDEKLRTYWGNYSIIKYAAQENGLDLKEVMLDLGFDSAIDYGEFVITSPQQILSFQEVDHQFSKEEEDIRRLPAEEEIGERDNRYAAFEETSSGYIGKAKAGRNYKTMPGNRFLRRIRIQTNGGNNIWFDMDMNRLFRKGSFAIKVPVIGETNQYVSTISFENWLPLLKQHISETGFNQLTVKRSLAEMARFHDLKIDCTCPDYRYRLKYHNSMAGNQEGEPELRPSDITNPLNDLGPLCKHLSQVMNAKSAWFDKVSRIIYNYFINLKRSQPLLFDRIIAPKLGLDQIDGNLGGTKKPEPVEPETSQENPQETQQEVEVEPEEQELTEEPESPPAQTDEG